MFATVRTYQGVQRLIDEMAQRNDEVEEILSSVDGFKSYYAIRNGAALTTVTVCDHKAGADESTVRAAAWVREKLPDLKATPPHIAGGEVFISFAG